MARPTTGVAYLTVILTVLGSIIFSMFVTVPAWSDLKAERLRLVDSTREREEKRAFLANIDARAGELASLEHEVRAVRVMFPEAVEAAEIAAVMHSLSLRDGVTVQSVSEPLLRRQPVPDASAVPPSGTDLSSGESAPTAAPAGASATGSRGVPYEFTVTVRGTYTQMRAFLLDLERALPFFDVPVVELRREEQDRPGEAIVGKITLRIYLAGRGAGTQTNP